MMSSLASAKQLSQQLLGRSPSIRLRSTRAGSEGGEEEGAHGQQAEVEVEAEAEQQHQQHQEAKEEVLCDGQEGAEQSKREQSRA